jgi:hypothetical protein
MKKIINIMKSQVKTITSVLKALTDITTNIPARPIRLTEILTIMSVEETGVPGENHRPAASY